jgi:cytochrome c oxidase subunit 2
MWPALVIMIGVLGACVALPIMFRRKKDDPGLPKQIHGNTAFELTWTIIPAIVMLVVGFFVVDGIIELGRDPEDDALYVNVSGQQFLWQFEYEDIVDADGNPIPGELGDFEGQVIGVLRIPVDREIALEVKSTDVNHSFWVPRLAGKIDAINGHPNHMFFTAAEAGTFVGQCAEFCGLQHAKMRLQVIAMEPADFDNWVTEQGGTVVAHDRDKQELASVGD